ncbi:MlaD family protein [Nocardia spumae]|uniref:MlaD family protein n=1 Tax=Nocardia spumae TaxID=2887190 RepID=UPI001D151AF2|nr:MlaD family protein [Nocardia spumae]
MSIAATVVIAAVVGAAYILFVHPTAKTRSYCALLPDSIGLYVGNHVTMRGMPVGGITAIHPQGRTVRVDFTVDDRYPVAADASATTVSDTLVADRHLAVLGIAGSGPRHDPAQCITKTLTPKSMTQTLDALAQLSQQTLGPGPDGQDAMLRGIRALDAATTGTGPQLHDIIERLSTAMNSPDAAIGHLAGVVDSLTAVSGSVATHWGDIKAMLTRLADVLDQVNNELFGRAVSIIDGFQRVLPMLNDITTMFGDPILQVLDAAVPLVHLIHTNTDALHDILTKIPVLVTGATGALDPTRGIAYAPPKVVVPRVQAQQLCALTQQLGRPECTGVSGDAVAVPLTQLVLGFAGAR